GMVQLGERIELEAHPLDEVVPMRELAAQQLDHDERALFEILSLDRVPHAPTAQRPKRSVARTSKRIGPRPRPRRRARTRARPGAFPPRIAAPMCRPVRFSVRAHPMTPSIPPP